MKRVLWTGFAILLSGVVCYMVMLGHMLYWISTPEPRVP